LRSKLLIQDPKPKDWQMKPKEIADKFSPGDRVVLSRSGKLYRVAPEWANGTVLREKNGIITLTIKGIPGEHRYANDFWEKADAPSS
jgi:hypothetical protein